ncbi:MAG: ArsA-related P-loop ATPase [Candidatus Dormibacteria bacterium]
MVRRSSFDPDTVTDRRVVILAGKGGVGKSSVAAGLALHAAHRGKRVLVVDVAADGNSSQMLGGRRHISFQPYQITSNIAVLSLLRVEALEEYLNVYFHMPRIARLTPFGKVIDFVATSVPGPKDILVLGKIFYEESRVDEEGAPYWDSIIVDGMATGHAIAQLKAPFAMQSLVHGGMIYSQVERMAQLFGDPSLTTAIVVATPEEMPVQEARQFKDAVQDFPIDVAGYVMNKVLPDGKGTRDSVLEKCMETPGLVIALAKSLEWNPGDLSATVELYRAMERTQKEFVELAREELGGPSWSLPLLGTRGAGRTARAIARIFGQHTVRGKEARGS